MRNDYLWSDCCEYLEREGYGDIGLLKEHRPQEYASVLECFEKAAARFRSHSETGHVGFLIGIDMFPAAFGEFLLRYRIALSYERGDTYRRHILETALRDFLEDRNAGVGREWGDTESMAYERLFVPRSQQLRREKVHRPDGADTAVSRASTKFRRQVWSEWRDFTGTSPWILGVCQFFVWKRGAFTKADSKQITKTFAYLMGRFYRAVDVALKELKQYGVPSRRDLNVWTIRHFEKVKREMARSPSFRRLVAPLVLEQGQGHPSSRGQRRDERNKVPASAHGKGSSGGS